MFIIFPAFCAPTQTLLMMLRSIASCRSLAMVAVSLTMGMSLRIRAAVLAARSLMLTSCGMSSGEGADAVLSPTALDGEDLVVENDLMASVGTHY